MGRKVDHPKLRIKKVKEDGLVHRWNQIHPEMAVVAGDFIMSANDATGSAHRILDVIGDTIRKKSALDLRIRPGNGRIIGVRTVTDQEHGSTPMVETPCVVMNKTLVRATFSLQEV